MKVMFAVFALLFAAAPVAAHTFFCGDRDKIAERLATKHGEALIGQGLVDEKQVVELFVDPDDGSFSIIISNTDGVSCFDIGGHGWLVPPSVVPEDGGT